MAPRGFTSIDDENDVEVEFSFLDSPSERRRKVVMTTVVENGAPTKPTKKRNKSPPGRGEQDKCKGGGGDCMDGSKTSQSLFDAEAFGPQGPGTGDWEDGEDYEPEPAFHEGIFQSLPGMTSEGKTTHEYMAEWVKHHCEPYLAAIFESEGKYVSTCQTCEDGKVEVRCLDCIGVPRLCRSCCRTVHRLVPFHKVETWVENRWQPAWLWQMGSIVCLGHGLSPCPYYKQERSTLEEMVIRMASLDSNVPEGFSDDPTYGAKAERGLLGLGLMLTFVHTNGYHQLPIFPCYCHNVPAVDIQLLKAGLYPSTSKETRTAFTIQLLKHFHLSTVDSHLSVEHYCSLLRRLSNHSFPSQVVDRRRELTRVWQQYAYMTTLKRNGFGIASVSLRSPKTGELALFCAACPQPGVNLPDNWKTLEDSWRFWRQLTADGNFVLEHLEILGPDAAVWLTNGAGYFAERKRFEQFLEATVPKERTEALTCNQLRAVADKNKVRRGYDSTGIVACACTRHGCFAPASVVDMQKGEKQANADYSLSQAFDSTKALELLGTLFAYDVNCQYCKRFRARFENEFLRDSIPPDAVIVFLIGLFHVHGHREECLARFAPTFAPGAGMAAAEILESLWSMLIGAAGMTRNMTKAHRVETLEHCIADINLKKLQGMESHLNKQHSLAVKGLAAAERDLERLDGNRMCSAEERKAWEELMVKANTLRLGGNVEAMDVYNAILLKIEGEKEAQVRLMRQERKEKSRRGVVEWLAKGLEIQKDQIELRAYIKTTRSDEKRGAVAIETERRRSSLLTKVETLYARGSKLFNGLEIEDLRVSSIVERNFCLCEDAEQFCNCEAELAHNASPAKATAELEVENLKIPLPSTVSKRPTIWDDLVGKEEALRVAEAHKALEDLRTHIAHKSYLYRTNQKLASGKRGRKAQYGQINSVESDMRTAVKRYDLARWALTRLGAISQYPELEELRSTDTKAIISVWDPNAAGQRDKELPWIWKVNIPGHRTYAADVYVKDLYRVNWIRARSRRDRWKEELTLLRSEMEWFVRFCKHRYERATEWASKAVTEGHRSYACGQANMWYRLGRFAKAQFLRKSKVAVAVELGPEGVLDPNDDEDKDAERDGSSGK